MQKTEKFRNAKVGDKVYCLIYGDGTISHILNDNEWQPIICDFKSNRRAYTYDGAFILGDCAPSLYWDKPEIIEQSRYEEVEIEGYWYHGKMYTIKDKDMYGYDEVVKDGEQAKVIIKRKIN